ncbi:uracil-xanthine permease [Kineococcus xinjiangensis]|uniref:Uracil-xanthine permease n=1 Tax=Kineococcus xinjiangensis TaxID=512762 RepID=A0A2S6IT55_9ACTN|nr:solute carrier family 23 protein [Kineococcus xinjiangensis]PPK97360.1 uracil-xanthine permease [Kineococcus xinjiangensis]
MNLGFGWTLHGDGGTPPPGESVAPHERLSWGRTVGIGAQHVVAMFGATFVFPVIMGLDPNLAILMSGVATVLFLLIVQGKVPSYLGTSASFVGAVATIRLAGGDSSTVTGAILVAGLALAATGVLIHVVGGNALNRVLPPVVTGAVVALIGLNLAPVVSGIYWPQDQWVAFVTMLVVIAGSVLLRGFLARIAIFVGLVFGFVLSWVLDRIAGPITSPTGAGEVVAHDRVDLSAVAEAAWIGLPDLHAPSFEGAAILVALPAVIALIAENAGHVKAVGAMTRTDLDPYLGRAVFADGIGTALASSVGGSPTTTYAENIGVMAATRVYSTAAYYVAAAVALLLGFCPKFGALIAATPGGVLGGITVVLYGMVALLGVKIWVENRVDFSNPLNLVPAAAGVIVGAGNVPLRITENFEITGIALGTLIVLVGYHLMRAFAPAHLRAAGRAPDADSPVDAVDATAGAPRPVARS